MKNNYFKTLLLTLLLAGLNFATKAQTTEPTWYLSQVNHVAVCPIESIRYTLGVPNEGCTSYTWTITNGVFIDAFKTTFTSLDTDKIHAVDVIWNNKDTTGVITVTGKEGCDKAYNPMKTPYGIMSVSGKKVQGMRINNQSASIALGQVIGNTAAFIVSFTPMISHKKEGSPVPQDVQVPFYEWVIPKAWSIQNRTATDSTSTSRTYFLSGNQASVVPDRCTGGEIKVRGVMTACSHLAYSIGSYYSDYESSTLITRPIPAAPVFTTPTTQIECGSTASVGISANPVANASSYTWTLSGGGEPRRCHNNRAN